MRSHILVPLIALAVVAQSCCCCTGLGGPQPPYAITPSDEAAQRLRERWNTAVIESTDGSFTITVTEEEVTSAVVQMLAEQDDLPPISDPQVHLRDGRIEVYATVTVGDSLAQPGLIAFSAAIIDGEIDVTIEESAFGPLPIPGPVQETLTERLNESLSRIVRGQAGDTLITDIQIGEGEMTISGQVSPP